jgi:hypothetical protein
MLNRSLSSARSASARSTSPASGGPVRPPAAAGRCSGRSSIMPCGRRREPGGSGLWRLVTSARAWSGAGPGRRLAS